MKGYIFILLLASTIVKAKYDRELTMQTGDITTISLPALFGEEAGQRKASTGDSIFTYKSNIGRISDGNRVFSSSLDNNSDRCMQSRVYGDELVMSCDGLIKVYSISGDTGEIQFKSQSDTNTTTALDFDWQKENNFLGVVSCDEEDTVVRFDYWIGQQNYSRSNFKNPCNGHRLKIKAFPFGNNWMMLAYGEAYSSGGGSYTGSSMMTYLNLNTNKTDIWYLMEDYNFVDDVSLFLDVQTVDIGEKVDVIVSYLVSGSPTPKAGYMRLTKPTNENEELDLKDYEKGRIDLPGGIQRGRVAFNTLNKDKMSVFMYDYDSNQITRCDLSSDYKVQNCLSTTEPVRLPETQYLKSIEAQEDSQANFIFVSINSIHMREFDQITMIFNFRENDGALSYDLVTDISAKTATASGTRGFFFRQSSYYVYDAVASKPYLQLSAEDFQASSTVTVTQANQANAISKTIRINKAGGFNTEASLEKIPDSQFYLDDNVRLLPINRGAFQANNPQFRFSNETGIEQLYLNRVFFDQSKLGPIGTKIWFTSSSAGISVSDDRILHAFSCQNQAHLQLDCAKSSKLFFPLPKNFQVVQVVADDNIKQRGIVTSIVGGSKVIMVYMDTWKELYTSFSLTLPNQRKANQVWFKLTGKSYTFWVQQGSRIDIYSSATNDLSKIGNTPSASIDVSTLNEGSTFCPRQFSKSTSDPNTVYILSQCPDDARLYTFNVTSADNVQLVNEKLVNNVELIYEDLEICSLGSEILALNTKSSTLLSMRADDEYSYFNLTTREAGYSSIDSLQCVRGLNAVVITGKDLKMNQQFSVIRGSSDNNPISRYHSTTTYNGTLERVSQIESSGMMVSVMDDQEYTFYRVFLNGPFFIYNNSVSNPDQQQGNLTLSMYSNDQKLGEQKVTITNQKFDGDIVIEQTESHNSTSGSYDLFNLAKITGHIFNIKVQNSSTSTITPRLTPGSSIKASTVDYTVQPQMIIQEGTRAIGLTYDQETTNILVFENDLQLTERIQLNTFCEEIGASIRADSFALVIMACLQGDSVRLLSLVKSFGTEGSITQVLQTNIGDVRKIHLTQTAANYFSLVVIGRDSNIGRRFIAGVGKNPEDKGFKVFKIEEQEPIANSKQPIQFFSWSHRRIFI